VYFADMTETTEAHGLYEENRALYRMPNLVASSIELGSMLQGIVDLATEATDCHACFVYLLDDGVLTMRAASPVYENAVGLVQMRLDEGLTGWVARHRTPELIRKNAMADPRMKFFPVLAEERVHSMVAVPIISRAGETIGVIVLHTEVPREFTEDTLKLLVHIASLVSGAIENAQLYDQQRRRVRALTGLSGLAEEVAKAGDATAIGRVVTLGLRQLLGAEVCQLYRLDRDGSALALLSSSPETTAGPEASSATTLLMAAFDGGAPRLPAGALWPDLDVIDLLLAPLVSDGERLGLLCAGAAVARPFTGEETEMARAIAHLAAIAIKRSELIEGLTNAKTVQDLFEALAAGSTRFAVGKAMEVGFDLTKPYVMLCAEPAAGRKQGSGEWRAAAELVRRDLAGLTSHSAVEAGPGPVRAVLALGSRASTRVEELIRDCRELGRRTGAVIGLSEVHASATESGWAYRQAVDAAMIARALVRNGGAIGYAEVGAYRYLVHIATEDEPHDRMRAAVDQLIAYDVQRQAALLDTLERYLVELRSVAKSAPALFVHPNTLRQRLRRIEELTGLNLDEEDLVSLVLAIKLARLHGRPAEAAAKGR
jgi:GAF domain-containing protein